MLLYETTVHRVKITERYVVKLSEFSDLSDNNSIGQMYVFHEKKMLSDQNEYTDIHIIVYCIKYIVLIIIMLVCKLYYVVQDK